MDLSIAIVSWNTRALLKSCLESVCDTIREIEFEVIVVDNGSTDGSAEMVAEAFPLARIIRNQGNQGFARANNQAIRASSGRHVLLLNSDAVLLGDAARVMVDYLDAHAECGAVGGQLLNVDGTFQSSFADFPGLLSETLLLTGLSRWLLPKTYPSYPERLSRFARRADWVSGAFLMVRRETANAVGLLDEAYFMYTEELDWCYRMGRAGQQVYYLPDAQAIHHSGGSSKLVPERKRAQLYYSKWLFMRKHRGAFRASIYRWLVTGISGLKMAVWLAAAQGGDATRRLRARQNVSSYRYLLTHF